MNTQGERLRQGIELAGFTKVAPFAESVNEKPITVRQHINRGRIPMRVVEKYVRALRSVGVTTEWLLYGKGPAPKGKEAASSPSPSPALATQAAAATSALDIDLPVWLTVQGPNGPHRIRSLLAEALKRGPKRREILKAAGLDAEPDLTGPYPKQVEMLRKLAKGATKVLGRTVTSEMVEQTLVYFSGHGAAAEPDLALPRPLREVAVRSYVGAGDEIISLKDDEEPLYWTPAPPGLEDAEATQIRGASMFPAYEDGDVLFHRRHDGDPAAFLGRVVILQTRSRKRYVKVLQAGAKKGFFDLVSFNRLSPTIENQQLLWVAPILWVKKRQQF